MKNLLFIGHAFHQQSRSHEFMLRLLSSHYAIEQVYLAPEAALDPGCLAAHTGVRYDVVLCWQIPPPQAALARIACDRVVFFPMYDHSGRWHIEQWMPFRDMRIIAFSSTL